MIVSRLQTGPFDLAAEVAALTDARTDIGAVVTFTGLVRDLNDGAGVSALTLETYPAMAERQLAEIAAKAAARWPLLAATVIHRYGTLQPGEPIVLVVVASAHRQAAFEAAAFLMDWLKTRAPFWKREDAGWVAAKVEDEAAAGRWKATKADEVDFDDAPKLTQAWADGAKSYLESARIPVKVVEPKWVTLKARLFSFKTL